MRRRDILSLLGGAAVSWPVGARAQQQSATIPRIGLLTRKTDASVSAQLDAFRQGLADLGWAVGTNIRIEHRDAEGQAEHLFPLALELVALKAFVAGPAVFPLYCQRAVSSE
jgi:putative tryptophan/tyrosine transport system substrate-binding protein